MNYCFPVPIRLVSSETVISNWSRTTQLPDLSELAKANLLPAFFATALSFTAGASELLDLSPTPRAIDPSITQQNFQSTSCINGYIKTHPLEYCTNKLKKRQIRKYEYTDMNPKHFEENQLIPGSIMDTPGDQHDIWPKSRDSEWNTDKKIRLVFANHRVVCDQKIHACGDIAPNVGQQGGGIQAACAWKSLSSWTWVWSCRLE
jgi:hypothetical protein